MTNRSGWLVVGALLLGVAGAAAAKPWWMRGVESNETDFLPPDLAFRVGARIDGAQLKIRWLVADGYYLYRQKIEIRAESPGLLIGEADLPRGVFKSDPYLGTQEIYRQQVEASVPYTRMDAGAHPVQIKLVYQGCADAGLCYPPISKVLYPQSAMPRPAMASSGTLRPWQGWAIGAGCLAFFVAGLVLRRGRRLEMPTL